MLFDERKVVKPFEYNWAYDYWWKQNSAHWMKEEVDMSKDVKDWNENLTEDEKSVIGNILKSFTQVEAEVEDYWSGTVAQLFPKPEIKMMANGFANIECVHIDSYSYLNTILNLEDFDAFLQDEAAMQKLDVLISDLDKDKSSISDIAKSLAIFSACAEGINLFSSFSILLSFKRENKLKGIGQIIEMSCRDEDMHSEAGCKLFRTILEEYPEIFTEEFKKEIYDAVKLAIDNEFYFIDQVFSNYTLTTINKEQVKNFIHYRANIKLKELMLEEKYDVDKSLLEEVNWFEVFTSGQQATDFFANQETGYSKPKSDWNDLDNLF